MSQGSLLNGKVILLGLVVVIIGLLIVIGVVDKTQGSIKPIVRPVPPLAATPIQAKVLLFSYKQNEVRADSAFKGQRLRVSGIVDTIGKDILGKPYVTLDRDGIMSVQCSFPKEKEPELAWLNPGQKFEAVCVDKGKLINVQMDCE